jgi:hypothetical protein
MLSGHFFETRIASVVSCYLASRPAVHVHLLLLSTACSYLYNNSLIDVSRAFTSLPLLNDLYVRWMRLACFCSANFHSILASFSVETVQQVCEAFMKSSSQLA